MVFYQLINYQKLIIIYVNFIQQYHLFFLKDLLLYFQIVFICYLLALVYLYQVLSKNFLHILTNHRFIQNLLNFIKIPIVNQK